MAEVGPQTRVFQLKLPLVFKKQTKHGMDNLTKDETKSLYDYIDKPDLIRHLQKSLPCIEMHGISLVDQKEISIGLITRGLNQLFAVYEVSKKSDKKDGNELSKNILTYLNSISPEIAMGLELGTTLHLKAMMSKKKFNEGMTQLDNIDDDGDAEHKGNRSHESRQIAKSDSRDEGPRVSVKESVKAIDTNTKPVAKSKKQEPSSRKPDQQGRKGKVSVKESFKAIDTNTEPVDKSKKQEPSSRKPDQQGRKGKASVKESVKAIDTNTEPVDKSKKQEPSSRKPDQQGRKGKVSVKEFIRAIATNTKPVEKSKKQEPSSRKPDQQGRKGKVSVKESVKAIDTNTKPVAKSKKQKPSSRKPDQLGGKGKVSVKESVKAIDTNTKPVAKSKKQEPSSRKPDQQGRKGKVSVKESVKAIDTNTKPVAKSKKQEPSSRKPDQQGRKGKASVKKIETDTEPVEQSKKQEPLSRKPDQQERKREASVKESVKKNETDTEPVEASKKQEPPSRKPAQQDRKDAITLIDKTIIVFIPTQDEIIDSVKLVSKNARINGSKMFDHRQDSNMFHLQFRIPVNELQTTVYSYQIDKYKYRLVQFMSVHNVYTTDRFYLDTEQVQRDIIPNFEHECIYRHLEDILFFTGKRTDIEHVTQCMDDIKNLLKIKPTFSKEGIQHMMNALVKLMQFKGIFKAWVLILVVFGNILKTLEFVRGIKELDSNACRRILETVRSYKLTDLPECCHWYMVELCLILTQIQLHKQYCLLRFINECHPFLNEFHFNAVIKRHLQQQGKFELVGENDQTLLPVAKRICHRLYRDLSNEDQAFLLLKRLLFHLPFHFVSEIGMELLTNTHSTHSPSVRDEIHGIVMNSIKAEIMKVKKSGRLVEIIILWNNVKAVLKYYVPENIIMLFQKEITELITFQKCKDMSQVTKDLGVLFTDEVLFLGGKSQHSLMVTLADSAIFSIHKSFITCIQKDKFTTVFEENMHELCPTWLKRAMETHLSHYKCNEICAPYVALSTLLAIEIVSLDSVVKSTMLDAVFKHLQKDKLSAILSKLDNDLEDIGGSIALEYFKADIATLLKRNHKTQKPEELLKCIRSHPILMINSRLTASTVCLILDEMLGVPDTIDDFDIFIRLVQEIESWTILLKSNGKMDHNVKSNKNFKRARNSVENVHKMLKQYRVNHRFLCSFEDKSKQYDADKLFKLCNLYQYGISWTDNRTLFSKQLQRIAVIQTVFLGIMKHVPENKLPNGFHNRKESIDKLEERVKQHALAVDLKSKDTCKELTELLPNSVILVKVVHSRLFWNVGLVSILDEFSKKLPDIAVDDIEESIASLFEENTHVHDDINVKGEHIDTFFDVVLDIGSRLFRDSWMNLMTDKECPMSACIQMFKEATVEDEIQIAESFLNTKVSSSVKVTLKRLGHLKKIQRAVEAMKMSLKSCNVVDEGFVNDIKSFEILISGDSSGYSFEDVGKSLETVFDIAVPMSDDTITVLHTIGSSSKLIDFLFKIVDEDIRNLIDAVEDISEQHVQETTVAALIEVKRFLQPILKSDLKGKARSLFELINRQINSNPSLGGMIPAKMDDCMNNLHNLMSLYNNVANRSEQTKEKILNIVKKGKFLFSLGQYDTKCDFSASYSARKMKNTHSKAALVDLRSRALLLANKQETKAGLFGNELESFVSFVDICTDISELVVTLNSTGHIRYKVFKEAIDAVHLLDVKENLDSEYTKWCHKLKSMRCSYYLINFLQGFQIHKLHTVLESDEKSESERDVETFLKAIHPNIRLEDLRIQYTNITIHKLIDEYSFLDYIGSALHQCQKNEELFERHLKCEFVKGKKLEDVVQRGRLLVAQLEESSRLVVRIVLTLYYNTVQRLPEANQVLFCSRQTKWAEIELLLHRCLGALEFYGKDVLYCITNVELLPNEIQFKLVEALRNLEPHGNYYFAVICRGSKNHPFIDELSDCVSKVRPLSDNAIEYILHSECPNVSTFTSDVAGLGKTSHTIKKAFATGRSIATLHISGPMTKDRIVNGLVSLQLKSFNTLHIDIGSLASTIELDTLLFELIVLRYVSTGQSSIYLPTTYVSIEIANSLHDSLLKSLQTAILFSRERLVWHDYNDYTVSKEINSPVQVVCQFLIHLRKGNLDSMDLFFSGSQACKPIPSKACREILRYYFPSYSGISFSIVNTFLNVLADQLKKLSSSSFFRTSRIKDMVGHKSTPTVRSSLVNALVDVSKEFSSRSVDSCRTSQLSTMDLSNQTEHEKHLSAAEGLTKRVEGMVRWEDSNHLMYVFHNQNIQTISPIYRDRTKVPGHIKALFESQMKKEMQDYKKMTQAELQTVLQKICRSNQQMLPDKTLLDMSKDYALTPDNLLKMILIILRDKAGIPVLVMGETGCGKTSLIRYLARVCEVNFEVLNMHAGVEEKDIDDKVLACNKEALSNGIEQYWLFVDEINTSEYVGLISDIICHHTFNGKSLAPNLVVMGACNPYKLRSEKAISTAGLKGKIQTDELSRLVYRVLPLPEMLVDYVWDFGSLSEADESTYIDRMVEGVFPDAKTYHKILSDLLSVSQIFARKHEDSSCSVSLRDVQRCKILTVWFMKILEKKPTLRSKKYPYDRMDKKDKAVILALAHCYHSRMSDVALRTAYREIIAKEFQNNSKHFKETDIYNVIKEEQEDILNRMDLPQGTAKNTALRENVFVLLVCILNRLPIFVVGKPGCSKSLSMQVIRNNLRGEDSKDDFFKTLPQLYCVSFQGSESSTSDGIVKVFEKAEKYQETNRADSVLSVVILDEIGLAEVSRFNPLKVLHNILEPDGKDRPNVAVVGISNWSLDASKMNRAIHLSRPEMDEGELFDTGKSISDSFVKENKSMSSTGMMNWLSSPMPSPNFKTLFIYEDLKAIAKSYFNYTNKLAFQNFHGLRDFYSLVKFFAREVSEKTDISSTDKRLIMMTGIERNFGGLPAERPLLLSEFKVDDMKQSCPVISLIQSNIEDQLARHLMLITTGESVLGILEQNLNDSGRQNREVIFGSQFEEDLTDDYNYRILNRIILCMEQGLVLILKDLENIYGSLYDMLNQNYTITVKKKNCRVALGPYSNPICHVADSFRCIVLVDDGKLKYSDPPFLNRFEKQYLRFSDIIRPEQRGAIQKLGQWVQDVSVHSDFDEDDAFPIFSEDMVSSLILQNYNNESNEDEVVEKCKFDLLWIIKPEAIVRLAENSCDSIVYEREELVEFYMKLPVHRGINGLLEAHGHNEQFTQCLMKIVFTNSNIHTKVLQDINTFKVQVDKLGAFKSEKQLSTRMRTFWLESNTDILFLQCSAVDDQRHIMLAKSVIEKFRLEFLSTKQEGGVKHVYLIVHLDRSKGLSTILSQINFLTNWKLVTLDSLEVPITPLPKLCFQSLHEALHAKRPLNAHIKEQLFWSFTRIKYKQEGRNVENLTTLITKIKNSDAFLETLDALIVSSIERDHPDIEDRDWQVRVACNRRSLQTASSFIDAIESQIHDIISVPLVKFIFVMEKELMLDTFFVNDSCFEERRNVWRTLISREDQLSTAKIPDQSGPECYVCGATAIELKMPFSKYIFEAVESTSDEYLNSMKFLKSTCGLDPEDSLPGDIICELQKKQELIVDQKLPRLLKYDYYISALEDYFEDFCNIISVQICPSLFAADRIHYTKMILADKTSFAGNDLLEGIVSLHIAIWNNLTVFSSHLQLFETCKDILTTDDFQLLATRQTHTKSLDDDNDDDDDDDGSGGGDYDNDDESLKSPMPDHINRSADHEYSLSDINKSNNCDNVGEGYSKENEEDIDKEEENEENECYEEENKDKEAEEDVGAMGGFDDDDDDDDNDDDDDGSGGGDYDNDDESLKSPMPDHIDRSADHEYSLSDINKSNNCDNVGEGYSKENEEDIDKEEENEEKECYEEENKDKEAEEDVGAMGGFDDDDDDDDDDNDDDDDGSGGGDYDNEDESLKPPMPDHIDRSADHEYSLSNINKSNNCDNVGEGYSKENEEDIDTEEENEEKECYEEENKDEEDVGAMGGFDVHQDAALEKTLSANPFLNQNEDKPLKNDADVIIGRFDEFDDCLSQNNTEPEPTEVSTIDVYDVEQPDVEEEHISCLNQKEDESIVCDEDFTNVNADGAFSPDNNESTQARLLDTHTIEQEIERPCSPKLTLSSIQLEVSPDGHESEFEVTFENYQLDVLKTEEPMQSVEEKFVERTLIFNESRSMNGELHEVVETENVDLPDELSDVMPKDLESDWQTNESDIKDERLDHEDSLQEKEEVVVEEEDDEEGEEEDEEEEEEEEDDEEEAEMKDMLVKLVCQKMLPSKTTLEHYKTLKEWLLKSNEVSSLVSKINPASKFIHHLRISSEVASTLILPNKLDYSLLHNLANCLLNEKDLDSSLVFGAMMDIIDKGAITSLTKCQQVLANYFLRCLLSNPESEAMSFFLYTVCGNSLLDKNISAFKPILSFAFECEQEVQEDILIQILRDGVVSETSSTDESDSDTMEAGFLTKVNSAVKRLHEDGKSQCPFIVMIVDLMEDSFGHDIQKLDEDNDEFSDLLEHLIASRSVLQEHNFDLQFLVACGFFKAFTKYLSRDLDSANEKIIEYMNALLARKGDSSTVSTMECYILKCLCHGKLRGHVTKEINSLAEKVSNLKLLLTPVTDGLRDCSIDICPLLFFLSPVRQKDILMLMDQANDDHLSSVKSLMDDIHSKEDGLLILLAYAERFLYSPRSYHVLDDKIKTNAMDISKQTGKSILDKKHAHFLKCLLGTDEFRMVYLRQSEQSSSRDCLLNTFLISLYSLCFAHGVKEDKTFFQMCLKFPCKLESKFLPGFPETDEKEQTWSCLQHFSINVNKVDGWKFTTCECQHRIVILRPFIEDVVCPVCSKLLHIVASSDTIETIETATTGFTTGNIQHTFYAIRNLSPLSCQILFLMIKGCLIGSLALGYEIPEHLEKMLGIPAVDIPQTLWTDSGKHWQTILKLLGVDEYSVGIFLQTILLHTQEHVFDKSSKMTNPSERLLWEESFEKSVQSVVENRFVYQREMVRHYRFLSNESNVLEDALLEVDETPEKLFGTIFRRKGRPSFDNFVSELYPLRERFPLLCLVMSRENELHLPAHIKPIMQWHMTVASTTNYAMRKHECLNMTVTDFIQQTGNKEKTDILRRRFGELQKSWTYLKQNLEKGITEDMITLHSNLKMEQCTIFTKDCKLYKLLLYLVKIQNDILDHILTLSDKCESVYFLMRSERMAMVPYVNIADVTEMHLLQIKDSNLNWLELIEENSQCDTGYGKGQKVWYDFKAIEKLLVQRLIPGTAYIIFSTLPQIVFTDELYKNYVALSNDIKRKVTQKSLGSDILSALDEKQKGDPRICKELMVQVGMIMTLLNKTGGDSSKCLIDYIEDMKNVLTKKFSEDLLPSPTTAIELGHIVALHEKLEEMNADTMIDALDDEYRLHLDCDQRNLFEAMVKTNKSLANYVLRACKRFINRCLSLREADADRPLLEHVAEASFWPEGMLVGDCLRLGDIEERLVDVIPLTVMVKNIYHLVNLIETELEKLREESMNMSKMATSWQSTQKNIPMAKDAKKKKVVTKRMKKYAV